MNRTATLASQVFPKGSRPSYLQAQWHKHKQNECNEIVVTKSGVQMCR